MKTVRVYCGYALTGMPQEYRDEMDALADRAIELSLSTERVRFLGTDWKEPIEVYVADIENGIGTADLAVLFLDPVGKGGVIVELCAAIWKCGIPVLLMSKKGDKYSGLIRGLAAKYPEQVILATYECAEHVTDKIAQVIHRLRLDSDNPVRFECLESFRARRLKECGRQCEVALRPGSDPFMSTESPHFLRGPGLIGSPPRSAMLSSEESDEERDRLGLGRYP